jgi:hypothetical protein
VSVALTVKVWLPTKRPVNTRGEVQLTKETPSSEHSNVAGSFAVKEIVASRM